MLLQIIQIDFKFLI